MERGIKSNKKHLTAIEYKIKKELDYLNSLIKKQSKTLKKDTLILQSRIFSDFYFKKLDFETKKKYSQFLKQHPLGQEFKDKMEESRRESKKDKKRGFKR